MVQDSLGKKVTKRKIDPPKHAIEIKVKKIDTIVKVKKSATKAELLLQLETLTQKYDTLEKENHANIHIISSLNEKLERITVKFAKGTQTESNILLKCVECNFEGVSIEELKWHMSKNHSWPDTVENRNSEYDVERDKDLICQECHYQAEDIFDYDGHVWSEICTDPTVQNQNDSDQSHSLSCQFCDEKFAILRELMLHKKRQHEDQIDLCWNYASGKCDFGDDNCWFAHHSDKNEHNFECNSCDKTFGNKNQFLHHKKMKHRESVSVKISLPIRVMVTCYLRKLKLGKNRGLR
jgi:hypothetical protein